MIIIFEIDAKHLNKQTFYSYCLRNSIQHFKNTENTHYYARVDTTKEEKGELSYILMRNYLEKKEIKFNVLFSSLDDS